MKRERKYNIWIAYSDLFANLTTFLFISALGLFAAVGSGARLSFGMGEAPSCELASEMLVQDKSESILKFLGNAPPNRETCSAYFQIPDFRFSSSSTLPGDFRSSEGTLRNRGLRQACEPVWLTLSEKRFANNNARIMFVGIAKAKNDWGDGQPSCTPPRSPPPEIKRPGLRIGLGDVRICDRDIQRKNASDQCKKIWECALPKEGPREICRGIAALRKWDHEQAIDCVRQTAYSQAATVAAECRRLPATDLFRDELLEESSRFRREALMSNMRLGMWDDLVVPDARIIDPPYRQKLVDPASTMLKDLPAGSVVIQIQYRRR